MIQSPLTSLGLGSGQIICQYYNCTATPPCLSGVLILSYTADRRGRGEKTYFRFLLNISVKKMVFQQRQPAVRISTETSLTGVKI